MKRRVNGVELYYKQEGAGPPLLLLHGNGEDHRIFDALVPMLAKRFAVYAVDSRNHGQSGRAADFSYVAMAADIRALIAALGLRRVRIAGFSDGAIVALCLALENAGPVERMALLGVNLSPADFKEEVYRSIRQEFEKTGDPLTRLMLEEPQIPLEAVRRMRVPTLLVAGEHDVFRPGTFESLAAALPDAELIVLPGEDHSSYIVCSDRLGPALLRFFGGQ